MTAQRKLAIALACSLALNLFLLGFWTARAFREQALHHHGPAHGLVSGWRGRDRDVGPAADEGVRRALRRHEDAFRGQGKRLRAARARVSAAFAAEPFDAAALASSLSELRAQTAESQRLLHDALIEVAPTLSREQRARLARHALARGGLGPGRRKH